MFICSQFMELLLQKLHPILLKHNNLNVMSVVRPIEIRCNKLLITSQFMVMMVVMESWKMIIMIQELRRKTSINTNNLIC